MPMIEVAMIILRIAMVGCFALGFGFTGYLIVSALLLRREVRKLTRELQRCHVCGEAILNDSAVNSGRG